MKRLLKIVAFIALLTIGISTLSAHGGGSTHKHEGISEAKIKSIASEHMLKLINEKKVDKSWSKSSIINSEKKIFNKKVEWVVSFGNDYLSNVEKQILYIFVSQDGKITGANYTGN